ncbi:SANT/Myb_domain [Hexamita inflata]|uniref:SANT/Myb domain n=1 Tax=Hexamita inflata TaxID=28002 RepID=A0AA86TY94_9EUKA|nr:SANT/Myb domain [Hexamita inflata]CAI9933294.1 SANT/Myb domain [Hexamita inflata]
MQINEVLRDNYILLHEIHLHLHQVNNLKYQSQKQIKDKWSKEEDLLMDLAISIFGINYKAISQVVTSKSSAQVYQRLRYLKDRQKLLNILCKDEE